MTELVISFEVEGLHCWPEAPDRYSEFRQPHKHIFKFICYFPVEVRSPVDRPTELFDLRRRIRNLVENSFEGNFGPMSCEGIADWVHQRTGASKVFVGEEWLLGAWVS